MLFARWRLRFLRPALWRSHTGTRGRLRLQQVVSPQLLLLHRKAKQTRRSCSRIADNSRGCDPVSGNSTATVKTATYSLPWNLGKVDRNSRREFEQRHRYFSDHLPFTMSNNGPQQSHMSGMPTLRPSELRDR